MLVLGEGDTGETVGEGVAASEGAVTKEGTLDTPVAVTNVDASDMSVMLEGSRVIGSGRGTEGIEVGAEGDTASAGADCGSVAALLSVAGVSRLPSTDERSSKSVTCSGEVVMSETS